MRLAALGACCIVALAGCKRPIASAPTQRADAPVALQKLEAGNPTPPPILPAKAAAAPAVTLANAEERYFAESEPDRRSDVVWSALENGSATGADAAVAELFRRLSAREADPRLQIEMLGAGTALEPSPVLRQFYLRLLDGDAPEDVREVALDSLLFSFPDEAARFAKLHLNDRDEAVRGVAEDFFEERREEMSAKAPPPTPADPRAIFAPKPPVTTK